MRDYLKVSCAPSQGAATSRQAVWGTAGRSCSRHPRSLPPRPPPSLVPSPPTAQFLLRLRFPLPPFIPSRQFRVAVSRTGKPSVSLLALSNPPPPSIGSRPSSPLVLSAILDELLFPPQPQQPLPDCFFASPARLPVLEDLLLLSCSSALPPPPPSPLPFLPPLQTAARQSQLPTAGSPLAKG